MGCRQSVPKPPPKPKPKIRSNKILSFDEIRLNRMEEFKRVFNKLCSFKTIKFWFERNIKSIKNPYGTLYFTLVPGTNVKGSELEIILAEDTTDILEELRLKLNSDEDMIKAGWIITEIFTDKTCISRQLRLIFGVESSSYQSKVEPKVIRRVLSSMIRVRPPVSRHEEGYEYSYYSDY